MRLHDRLAFMLSTTSIPTSIVKHQSFLNYIGNLNPRHSVPDVNVAGDEISDLHKRGREILKGVLGNLVVYICYCLIVGIIKIILHADKAISKLCITCDGWSKKGLKSSYLGTTVHFVSQEAKMESAVLDMKEITGRHTGETIGKMIREVLEDWQITNLTLFAIIDNGSNMVKAFKIVQEMYLSECHNFPVEETVEESESSDEIETAAIETVDFGFPVDPGSCFF